MCILCILLHGRNIEKTWEMCERLLDAFFITKRRVSGRSTHRDCAQDNRLFSQHIWVLTTKVPPELTMSPFKMSITISIICTIYLNLHISELAKFFFLRRRRLSIARPEKAHLSLTTIPLSSGCQTICYLLL